jgi:hypothetical protein
MKKKQKSHHAARWSNGIGSQQPHPLPVGPSRSQIRAETAHLVAEYYARKDTPLRVIRTPSV